MTKQKIRKMFFNKEITVRKTHKLLNKYFNPEDDIDKDINNALLISSWLTKIGVFLYGRDEYEQADVFDIIWGYKNDPLDENDKEPIHIKYEDFLEIYDPIMAKMPLNIYEYKYIAMDQYRRNKKVLKRYDEAVKYALEVTNSDKSKILHYPGKPFSENRKKPVEFTFKLYSVFIEGEEYLESLQQEIKINKSFKKPFRNYCYHCDSSTLCYSVAS